MARTDDQFTADELELMRGESAPAQPEPSPEALADAAMANEDPPADTATNTPAAAEGETPADASLSSNDSEGQPEGFIPQFDGTVPQGYDEQKKAIREEKLALRSKWSNGELSDEEWAAQEASLDDKYEALQAEYLTAQALQKANEQIAAQQQRETLQKLAKSAKAVGIDYSDPGLGSLFDNRLSMVASEEAFKGKPFEQIAAEANRRVLELFGKTAKAADAAVEPNPKGKGAPVNERANIPPTLGQMPAAAAQPVNSNLDEMLATIDDPDILEAKWAALPTQQRSAVLRSTLPSRR